VIECDRKAHGLHAEMKIIEAIWSAELNGECHMATQGVGRRLILKNKMGIAPGNVDWMQATRDRVQI
jgi:hypothetical protein